MFLKGDSPTLIFRSDSNGEDLEGFAGAGLYESVMASPAEDRPVDYTEDKLFFDEVAVRLRLLACSPLASYLLVPTPLRLPVPHAPVLWTRLAGACRWHQPWSCSSWTGLARAPLAFVCLPLAAVSWARRFRVGV